jgi:hypothetical protein
MYLLALNHRPATEIYCIVIVDSVPELLLTGVSGLSVFIVPN